MTLDPPAAVALAAVIDNDLLGFRHIFRHSYDFTLDREKLLRLWARWASEGPGVLDALAQFRMQLAALASHA